MKLSIELIPRTCWFSNVRSHVSRSEWDWLRKQVYSAAYDVCEICGGVGPKHPVEAHEIWEFNDETLVQRLTGMIALCPNCHQVKHIGLAGILGHFEKALAHFKKINKLSDKAAKEYVREAFAQYEARSKKNWKLDISYLKEYKINIKDLKEKK